MSTDNERYTDSYCTSPAVSGKYVYCGRIRCDNKIMLQSDRYNDRLPQETIVVSMDDGTSKLFFCSLHCTVFYLETLYNRQRSRNNNKV